MDRANHQTVGKVRQIHHNVYDISTLAFLVLVAVVIDLWVLSYAEMIFYDLPAAAKAGVALGSLLVAAGLAVVLARSGKETEIIPYTRQPGFEFIGLHNLNGKDLSNQHDILPRGEEVAYIHRMLEEIIFPQATVKQALTLVGPSGCGKSTILSFFRREYGDGYEIFDFSGNYHELGAHIEESFGTNLEQRLSELTGRKKVIVILDQFERFFHLSGEEQEKVQGLIRHFCRRDVAVVVSMREEYLADFLKRFDMNNLAGSWDATLGVDPKGILKELINVLQIRDRSSIDPARTGKQAHALSWGQRQYKNNIAMHLNLADNLGERVVLEKVGPTLLYCRNQKDVSCQAGQKVSASSILASKCRKLFGGKGDDLYQRHADEPLIEQQIFFHMAEFNQKINAYTEEELNGFFSMKNNELLNQYFSIQLSCCPDYFLASRLLYLLSKARTSHISITKENISESLFPTLFYRKGNEKLLQCIRKLEELQLIRKSIENSDREYEIAHDFIAESFLSFCSIIMDRDVRNALDLYIAELTDPKRSATMPEKYRHRSGQQPNPFFAVATIVTIILITVGWIVEKTVWNPWHTLLADLNPYGRYVPFFPLLINTISVGYLYYLYDRIMKYYRGHKTTLCRQIYLFMMLLVVIAVLGYPHFLLVDGICLSIAAFNAAFLLDRQYPESCRRDLRAYGFKSAMIGLVFAAGHIIFLIFNQTLPAYLIVSEFIMFTILVAYATYAHLTQEFLFSHMAEAASEKI